MDEIARFPQTDVSAVSRLVDRLQEKQFVQRGEDPTSRRRVPIKLTDRGRNLVSMVIELADRNDESFFRALSAEQRAHLSSMLQPLDRHADIVKQETEHTR